MERTAVRSKDIAIVGYDTATSTLEIAFKAGGVYRYFDVPSPIYQELLKAESHGTYFNQQIKEKFKFENWPKLSTICIAGKRRKTTPLQLPSLRPHFGHVRGITVTYHYNII